MRDVASDQGETVMQRCSGQQALDGGRGLIEADSTPSIATSAAVIEQEIDIERAAKVLPVLRHILGSVEPQS